VFVCPLTKTTLEELYSNAADTLYPTLDGIPVLVAEPEHFLRRHGPWDPRNGVAGQPQEIRGVWSPDAVTPFLSPEKLEVSGPFGDFLLDQKQTPDDWVAETAALHAPAGVAVDLGCGLGPMALRMAAQGRDVVAIDIDPATMLMCRDLLSGTLEAAWVPTHRRGCQLMHVPLKPVQRPIAFAIADAAAPPLPEGMFAWVHLGLLLDELRMDDLVKVLLGAVGLLGRGSVLSITTSYDGPGGAHVPEADSPEPEFREVMGELGLTLVEEADKLPHVTRLWDRRFEVRLVHASVWRVA
jgi:SAM-dependent methyltransferase